MNNAILRHLVNTLALLGTLAVNFLAMNGVLGGVSTAVIANRYPIYFLPANYVFGIWGIIYLALIGFVIYQALPAQREHPSVQAIGYLFTLTCIANAAWLLVYQYELFAASMVIILVLLFTLIAIYLRLETGKMKVTPATRWLIQLPFSLYLGWITVATIANASYVLAAANWDGFGINGAIWATVLLVIATVIGSFFAFTRSDVAYTLVLIWAFVGIAVKQSATPQVADSALVLSALLLVVLLASFFKLRRPAAALPA